MTQKNLEIFFEEINFNNAAHSDHFYSYIIAAWRTCTIHL